MEINGNAPAASFRQQSSTQLGNRIALALRCVAESRFFTVSVTDRFRFAARKAAAPLEEIGTNLSAACNRQLPPCVRRCSRRCAGCRSAAYRNAYTPCPSLDSPCLRHNFSRSLWRPSLVTDALEQQIAGPVVGSVGHRGCGTVHRPARVGPLRPSGLQIARAESRSASLRSHGSRRVSAALHSCCCGGKVLRLVPPEHAISSKPAHPSSACCIGERSSASAAGDCLAAKSQKLLTPSSGTR